MTPQPKSHPPISEMSVIITGATRGIGAGIALKLARLGASLTLGYLDRDDQALSFKASLERENPNILLHKGDLTTATGAGGIVRAAIARYGRVDALVSNMGPFLWKSIAETSQQEWDHMIAANLSSHFYLVSQLLGAMRERGWGNFVFIGGVGSGQVTGHPRAAAYNAAKVGLAEFMRTLAIEEGPNGIRSNMIAPGVIDNGEYTDGFKERIVGDIPLGYVGQPDDIANAVAWLLSSDSGYVSGAIIDVSGGYHLTMR